MTLPHAPAEPSPQDGAFLRSFFLTLLLLLGGTALFTWLVDPLGRFGTGLVAPVITADRDQKAALLRARTPRPTQLILGSSRARTLDPRCLSRLSGEPAFNFAVNGASSDDLLAILHYLRALPLPLLPHALVVGVDPEMLQGPPGPLPGLVASRALGPFTGPHPSDPVATLGADLLGWQNVSAAAHSIWSRVAHFDSLPSTVLEPDGRQRSPRIEAAQQRGDFSGAERVVASIPGILRRYESFGQLDPDRVLVLRQFFREAHRDGIRLVAFIPPVHPAFERAAQATAWRARTEETVVLLRSLDREGVLRYVERDALPGIGADSTAFVDAIHFLAPVADRLLESLFNRPGGCALQ
ncbi:MAG: hypothetical protein ABI587_08900 [Gemmatimonadales bacterium]